MIEDSRPFCDFSKPGMVKFLELDLSGYKPPTRQTIAKKLDEKYKFYKSKLKETLSGVTDLALTTDKWKNKHQCHILQHNYLYF